MSNNRNTVIHNVRINRTAACWNHMLFVGVAIALAVSFYMNLLQFLEYKTIYREYQKHLDKAGAEIASLREKVAQFDAVNGELQKCKDAYLPSKVGEGIDKISSIAKQSYESVSGKVNDFLSSMSSFGGCDNTTSDQPCEKDAPFRFFVESDFKSH